MYRLLLQATMQCAVILIMAGIASAQDFESSTSDSAVGYIDNAVIRNRFRFRFDHYSTAPNPDRAEYMFPLPIAVGGRATQAIAPLDWQAYRAYTEITFGPRFSLFGDFGIRDIQNGFAFDPISQSTDTDHGGGADTFVGLRYGIIAEQYEHFTIQLKVGLPTGDPRRCLGTGHTSIEAGLLYNLQRTDRLAIFGELKDWVSINAYGAGVPDENSSNVLSYGFGFGYDLLERCQCSQTQRLTAVFEVLGWTVLEGLRSTGIPADIGVLVDATDETIVNAKYGLRYWQGKHSVYAGYGHSMTGRVWYEDVVRVEYTRNF